MLQGTYLQHSLAVMLALPCSQAPLDHKHVHQSTGATCSQTLEHKNTDTREQAPGSWPRNIIQTQGVRALLSVHLQPCLLLGNSQTQLLRE
jgi:hypothetical protein